MPTEMFNVRVDDTLLDAIEASAASVGLKKSVWAREVLGAVALGGVTLDDLTALVASRNGSEVSPHPARYLAVQKIQGRTDVAARGCKHPVTARQRLPFTEVCGVCKTVVKRT
jgi:hypothetical protein